MATATVTRLYAHGHSQGTGRHGHADAASDAVARPDMMKAMMRARVDTFTSRPFRNSYTSVGSASALVPNAEGDIP
jgi:hypothetical protein